MAKGKYEYWLTEDGLLLLQAWARDGLTDEQIAKNIGINVKTLWTWKNTYDPICKALKKGKEVVDIEVENALFKKALGFKETVRKPQKVKRVMYKNGKKEREWEEIIEAEEDVFVPPDTTAQIFWLKNRKPEDWRDKRDIDTSKESLDQLDKVLKEIGGVV